MNPKFMITVERYLEIASIIAGRLNVSKNSVYITSVIFFICMYVIIYKIVKSIFPLSSIQRTTEPARATAPPPRPSTPNTPPPSTSRTTQPPPPPNISNRSQTYKLNYEANTTMRNRYFKFELRYRYGSWRAYILNGMNYAGWPTDGHSTHRHYDGELNLYYVCWSVPIQDLEKITKIAKMWADATMRYIKTGNFR